jgi:NAD(P)-dependent dehydrogenase (short-subunit alcohol dehydrogenase family)/predicted N-acetyltransferase YhbS
MKTGSKVAVVTGGARGIGLAIARMFLGEGYRVALLDIDAITLARTAAVLEPRDRVLAIECDVADSVQVAESIDRVVARHGRIDALVNNAGIAVFKPILETTFDEWARVIAVNLTGPFLCTQACVPVMLRTGGGAVVNIASISGLRASTLRVAYGTSKAALLHLTKQQAAELGVSGIRVNAVAPGPVDTAMAKQVHTPAIRAGYHDAIPLNRYGTEEEIAAAVVFLCSEAASYINGQTLAVDGGFDATGIGLPALRDSMSTAVRPRRKAAVTVRDETPHDVSTIRAINIAAFKDHPYSQRTEHLIVEALRDAGALELSLVAEMGVVVGHIAFSSARLGDASSGWYLVGPVAVAPQHQGHGIGRALIEAGLGVLRSRGASGFVLVGDPALYGRFGFRHYPGVTCAGVPDQNVLCLPVGAAAPAGEVRHHPAFHVRASTSR